MTLMMIDDMDDIDDIDDHHNDKSYKNLTPQIFGHEIFPKVSTPSDAKPTTRRQEHSSASDMWALGVILCLG